MTTWRITYGDILDLEADVLICSANPFLTLSGGVGGAFALRFGSAMQEQLNAYLDGLGVRHVTTGSVVRMPPCGSAYKCVLHAVAVDGMYESSPEMVTRVCERAFALAEESNAASLVLPALATGYGKLTKEQFAEGLRPMLNRPTSIEYVVVCLRRKDDADLIGRQLGLHAEE